MRNGIVYVARALASFVVASVGLILLASVLLSGKWTARTIAVSVAIAGGGLLSWPRSPNAWRRDPPTDRQIAYAQDLGIDIPAGVSKGELSDLITQATNGL